MKFLGLDSPAPEGAPKESGSSRKPPGRIDRPPAGLDPENPIPLNILAFRSITSILSFAQKEQPLRITMVPTINSSAHRQQLRILTALSNIAVTHHGVVAAMLKVDTETIQVILSAELGNEELIRGKQGSTPDEKPTVKKKALNFAEYCFASNTRRDNENKPRRAVLSIPLIDPVTNGAAAANAASNATPNAAPNTNPNAASNTNPNVASNATPNVASNAASNAGSVRELAVYLEMCW